MTDIREYLAHKPLLFDGGMGTYYKAAPGADCEMANLTDPEGVKKVHAEYLAAGAQAIKTNTFGLPRMAAAQMPGWEELAEAGWKLACDAAAEKDAAVFADLGPAPDTEAAPASSAYGLVAQQFAALGAKNFLFETLSSDVGIVEAVKALRVAVPDAFVMVSFAVLPDGYTREGADELIAGGGGDDLDEGAHIAGDVVTVGVGLADALPVHILGAYQPHEGGGSVQLLLGQRLNGEGDILAGQHRHGGVIRTLAAGAGEDLHGDGDGLGLLTGQGAIGQHPGHIGRGGTGGHHHIGVAGIQHDGGVLAVELLLIVSGGNDTELLGGGQLDVGDHVCGVDLGIVTGILQADLTHRRLQQRLIVHAFPLCT